MRLEPSLARRLYRALYGSRLAEQAITDLAVAGTLPGHHSGLGHESIGVGVGCALADDDCVSASHRSGMMLAHARGALGLRDALLAKFGRAAAASTARADIRRPLPGIGLVGSALPMAVGIAMADQLRGRRSATVAFFGDGAANEGAVHEALNLAGARRAPIVFVLENNGLAISTPASAASAAEELVTRATGYGIAGVAVDGQDVVAIHEAADAALRRARDGGGPTLIEARLERWEPHAHGLPDLRTSEQCAAARAHDGLARLRARVLAAGALSEEELVAVEHACRAEIESARAEALRLGFDRTEPPPYDEATAWRLSYAR